MPRRTGKSGGIWYDSMRASGVASRLISRARSLTRLRPMSLTRWLLTALSFAVMLGASAWVVSANWPIGGMPWLAWPAHAAGPTDDDRDGAGVDAPVGRFDYAAMEELRRRDE